MDSSDNYMRNSSSGFDNDSGRYDNNNESSRYDRSSNDNDDTSFGGSRRNNDSSYGDNSNDESSFNKRSTQNSYDNDGGYNSRNEMTGSSGYDNERTGGRGGNSYGGSGSGQNEDYLDKGLDAAERKFGGQYGMGDSTKMRDTNEKITDGARNLFEKVTGKDVPDKFSN